VIDKTVEQRGPSLSNEDLAFLFEDHHRDVAERAKVTGSASDRLSDQAKVALLGEQGLCAYFARDKIDVRALCLIREALAWYDGAIDSLFAVQGLGTWPIHAFGTEQQKQRWLPDALSGKAVAAFGLTEPEAGTDVASLKTLAVRDGGEWRLTGRKMFISNAPVADRVIVFANAEPEKGRKGITAFIVRTSAPGFRVVEDLPLVADHSIGSLELSECLVPDEDRLGAVGDGFKIAMATLDTFRVTVGAAAVGMARRALDEATRRVTVRKQFGKELAEFQQVQGYLAESAAELDAARLLVLRAARLRDGGASSITQEAAIAKMFATEAAQRIIDRCLQLHGGLGVVRGVAVERLYREIRALRIYEGTTEIQRVVIATRLIANEKARGA